MKTKYILLILILAGFQTYTQESKLLTQTKDSTFCIDSSEFKLGPLHLGLLKSDVLKIIGKPDSIKIDSGLINYQYSHYYEGLRVHYWDSAFLWVETSSDKYITPSGIHTGLSRDQVFGILGLEPNEISTSDDEMEFSACQDDHHLIYFVFDDSFVLREIIIGIQLF